MEYLFGGADVFSPAQHETELVPALAAADSALTAPEPSSPLVDIARREDLR